MAKTRRNSPVKKPIKVEKFDIDNLVSYKYQWIVFSLIVFVLMLILFAPVFFGGKIFQAGDIITIRSMRPYTEQDKSTFTLWNPYLFCGMPAYATSIANRWFDLISLVYSKIKIIYNLPFSNSYAIHTFNLLLLGLMTFLLMRHFKLSFGVSLFSGIAAAFSTGIVVYFYIGHLTKLVSLPMFPLILLMLLKLQERIKLIDILILVIAMHILVVAWHIQIIFYVLFAILIYYIYYFLRAFRLKDKLLQSHLIKSVGILIVAGIIAGLISFDTYAQLFQYNKYSTRGSKSIVEQQSKTSETSESDFYQYATNWSFSPGEVLTFVVPSFYGFGHSTYDGPLTQNQPYLVNTYFGQMPFVDVAMYMGVVVFFLGLFSIYANWKMPFIRYLTIVTGIALLISFGRTFPLLYDLMYNYFPLFNKFRVPSMILVLVQMSFPILAGFGLMKIISLRNEPDQRLTKLIKNLAYIFTVLFALALLFNSGLSDWFIGRVQDSGETGQRLKPLYDYMSSMFIGDTLIAFALSALTFWISYAYINGKTTKNVLYGVLILFVVFDLFRIDSRGKSLLPLSGSSEGTIYVDKSQIDDLFNQPDYITAIKNQNDKSPYRIINIKQDGSLGSVSQSSNYNAYFFEQDFYGYSAIKPRTYQDYMDVVGYANPTLWRMLNVKYIITDQKMPESDFKEIYSGNKTYVYDYLDALPRAYLVDSVAVDNPLDILKMVKNNEFDPQKVAFVKDENLKVDKPGPSAHADITDYKDEYISINVDATGNNFLFLGGTYYPHGWKAYIDGKQTKIYDTNHGFRGIVVPKGNHKVEFIYSPMVFYVGKYLSLILSSLVFLGIIIFFVFKREPEKQV
jgi:Bacterial membrane protein YfhO